MNREQTYLTDYVCSGVVSLIMQKQNKTMQEALDIFYNSRLADQLADPETGLYLQSKYYNYELLENNFFAYEIKT